MENKIEINRTKKYIIFLLSIAIVAICSCKKNKGDETGDEISDYILNAEVTNRLTRNMSIDNTERKITFDLASTESKTGVNIKLTLVDGVSMVAPKQEQENYDLSRPAEIKLSAGGRTIVFTVKTGVFDPITKFILATEVTNRQSRHILIKNAEKEMTLELARTESKTDVNIKLTLADGVSMVSPDTEQAAYDLSKTALIELLADGRKITFAIKAGEFEPQPPPPAKKLVIGIWVPPPPHLLKNDTEIRMRYKQIVDAGINMVWCNQWAGAESMPILNACSDLGLDCLVWTWVSKLPENQVNAAAELTQCLNTANNLKNHPAVCGFGLNDEAPESAFDRMGVVRREVEAVLPEGKFTTSNLYPIYAKSNQQAYEAYIENFMQKVRPSVLSFDHYPLYNTNDMSARQGHDRTYAANLISIRKFAIQYNVPFWGFIQAIGYNGRREPTMNEYRWQCNAHIAFGAKGFSYFIYSAAGSDGGAEALSGSMLTWDGQLTYRYDYAKNINEELSGFANAVMPYKQDGFILVNQNAQMNQTIPVNLQRASYGNLSEIEASCEMMNGCYDLNGQKAVYLFNWSKDKPLNTKLSFNGIVHFQLWGKEGLELEQNASELNLSFIPAEAKFLIFM